ncbi:unannotated protein [freshwater metagenome]|uniref:Unannotated protein n=1 Tax=freshwater metagenome TaxID=449393 RepID=A0A6J7CZY7_9ZZZZ|nr:hypothetical protein [Actinomycetota bacterium]
MSGLDVTRHGNAPGAALPADPLFFFDLANPQAYLVAERILQVMPVATAWIPVLARELAAPQDWATIDAQQREDYAERVAQRGLQPLRWPQPFPADSALAMRAATFARSIGRVVPFSLAAFRQAFAGGHDLEREETILIAGSACEMHPKSLLAGCATRVTRDALARATEMAARCGARDVPAVWVPGKEPDLPGRIFHGDDDLDRAAAAALELAAS